MECNVNWELYDIPPGKNDPLDSRLVPGNRNKRIITHIPKRVNVEVKKQNVKIYLILKVYIMKNMYIK